MPRNLNLSRCCVAIALISFWAMTAYAAEEPKQKTASYAEAKAIVMQNGFMPMMLKHDEKSLLCFEDFCRKRPEAFYCSGTGLNFCDFAFERQRDHHIVVIETFGDDSVLVHEVRSANKSDLEKMKDHGSFLGF